jgi:hypothetical protein
MPVSLHNGIFILEYKNSSMQGQQEQGKRGICGIIRKVVFIKKGVKRVSI